jgi:hypothetical protein
VKLTTVDSELSLKLFHSPFWALATGHAMTVLDIKEGVPVDQ